MSLPLKVFAATLAAAFVFASPADATKKEQAQKGRVHIHDDSHRQPTPRYQSFSCWSSLFQRRVPRR